MIRTWGQIPSELIISLMMSEIGDTMEAGHGIDQLMSNHKCSDDEENEHQIDIQDSLQMNPDQQACFLTVRRSNSSGSVIDKILSIPSVGEARPLFWERQPQNIDQTEGVEKSPEELRVFRPIKKERLRKKCDYNKNICGYITKKIIREFVGQAYQTQVTNLCKKYKCSYREVKIYYQSRREYVTGPSHLPELMTPKVSDSRETEAAKETFRDFYGWFLKERYLRYLILEGKMDNKQAYIEYKNSYLFKFIADSQNAQREISLKTRKSSQRGKTEQIVKGEESSS